MQIKITTTLNISPEYMPLIPVVASKLEYQSWKEAQLLIDPETAVEPLDFFKWFLAEDFRGRVKNLVIPAIDEYFGVVMKGKANTVKSQLDSAVTSEVEVIP